MTGQTRRLWPLAIPAALLLLLVYAWPLSSLFLMAFQGGHQLPCGILPLTQRQQ